MKGQWFACLCTVVLVSGFACSDCASEDEGKAYIGLVTNEGHINDNTFNQAAYEGAMRAQREFGFTFEYIESEGREEGIFLTNIERFAKEGYEHIITVGFWMSTSTEKMAAEYPETNFSIVDFAYESPPSNLTGIVFREDQAGYLAGVLAARMTDSEKVACLGGVKIPPVMKFCNGYKQAVLATCMDCEARITYVDSFTDEALGRSKAQEFIDQGCDVIFGVGGLMGSTGILHAAQKGAWVIGVDLDEYLTTFKNGEEPASDRILSSAMKRVDTGVYDALKATMEGTFRAGTMLFEASNEGIGLAPFHEAETTIPERVKTALTTTYNALSDGSLDTGVDPDTGEIIE